MPYQIEIDQFEIEKALEKIYYLKRLYGFKNIYGDDTFKNMLKNNSLNSDKIITYYDSEENYYMNGYLSMDSMTFEFISLFFNSYSEEQIYYQTYKELLRDIEDKEPGAIELYNMLTKDYMYDMETIECLLDNTVSVFTFYIKLVSKAINISLNDNDSNRFDKIIHLIEDSFESAFMGIILEIRITQKEDEKFYILAIGDPIHIIRLWENIDYFYNLFNFCKKIIEGVD